MVASSSGLHGWERAAAAAQAAAANADFMAALAAKSPKAAGALEAFAKKMAHGADNSLKGNHGSGGGTGLTSPVVIPPVAVTLPVIVPAVVAAVAQPVSAAVTGRKPAVPPGQFVSAAVSSVAAGNVPTPPGKALGLLKHQPPAAPLPPADVSPEPAPEPAALADTAVAPPAASERVSLLYRATEARAKSALPTVAAIGQEMLSAVGAPVIAPKQAYQAQLGTMVQQLLDTPIDVRDDTRHAEPDRHERTDRPYRTDVTA